MNDQKSTHSQHSKTSSELDLKIEQAIDDEISANPEIVDKFSDLNEFKR